MVSLPQAPGLARAVLELARNDPRRAEQELAALSPEQCVAVVCEAPLARRAELLGLLTHPEKVIPALPEAELCFIAKSVGLHDAGWILVHAATDQLLACFDLDAWRDHLPDRKVFSDWMRALAHADEDTLLRVAHEMDAETLCLWLRSRIEAWLKDGDGEFEPPDGARSLDGQFYYRARQEKDDLVEVEVLLRTLFHHDYWRYFRMMQSVNWELEEETEEWALRWRDGRLQDLGFPTYEEALAIYAPLKKDALGALPEADSPIEVGEWSLPIWMPRLPDAGQAAPTLLRALASQPEQAQRRGLFRLIALANRVAVADRLPLGDAESIPEALRKAVSVASRGLEHLASENLLSPVEVLDRASIERLFRVGANLERNLHPLASDPSSKIRQP